MMDKLESLKTSCLSDADVSINLSKFRKQFLEVMKGRIERLVEEGEAERAKQTAEQLGVMQVVYDRHLILEAENKIFREALREVIKQYDSGSIKINAEIATLKEFRNHIKTAKKHV